MLYHLFKTPAQIAFKIYCKKFYCNRPDLFEKEGPILIAANHPNSFLDAIILATLFKKPIYSLARGDVFKNKLTNILLGSLNILPVYRLREGSDNLSKNYNTFDSCIEIFKKNGIVLIFSEGLCYNEWVLRPLKKGTARLSLDAWEKGIPLTVIPVGINYSNFYSFGKEMHVLVGDSITKRDLNIEDSFGKQTSAFNQKLENSLKGIVYQFDKNDVAAKESFFANDKKRNSFPVSAAATIGKLIHLPLILPVKFFVKKYFTGNDHFDSVMLSLYFLAYPWYLFLMTLLAYYFLMSPFVFSTLIVMPFFAWCYIQQKVVT